MSALNLVLHPGHIYCRECLVQIPATFLACPVCCGLVRENGRWVAPAREPEPTPTPEQPRLFAAEAEYPA